MFFGVVGVGEGCEKRDEDFWVISGDIFVDKFVFFCCFFFEKGLFFLVDCV